jgi:hypothetical protein
MNKKRRSFLKLSVALLSQMSFFKAFGNPFEILEDRPYFSGSSFFTLGRINFDLLQEIEEKSSSLTNLNYSGDFGQCLTSEDFYLIPFSQRYLGKPINTCYMVYHKNSEWRYVTTIRESELRSIEKYFAQNSSDIVSLRDLLPIDIIPQTQSLTYKTPSGSLRLNTVVKDNETFTSVFFEKSPLDLKMKI